MLLCGVALKSFIIKPSRHQQQCQSNIVEATICNIVECYKLKNSFDKVERCFNIVATFGNNVKRFFRENSSFQQRRNKLNIFVKATFNLVETIDL